MYVCICACACVCVCVARIYIKIVIRPMKTISCTTGSGRKKQIKDTNLHLNRGWCRLDPEPSECSFLPRTTRTEKFSSAGYMEFETEPPTAVFMLHKFVYFTIYEHRNGFHTFIVKFHSPYINYYTSKKKKKNNFHQTFEYIYQKNIYIQVEIIKKKKKKRDYVVIHMDIIIIYYVLRATIIIMKLRSHPNPLGTVRDCRRNHNGYRGQF